MTQSIHTAASHAAAELRAAGVASPETDVWRLLAFAAKSRRGSPLSAADELNNEAAALFETCIERRARRQPVSQIVGHRRFFESAFAVNSAVLDPRPESETLVIAAIERNPRRVLDLGTGSGCLLLSVLRKCPHAVGVGVDISPPALDVAALNAKRLGLDGRARLALSDWSKNVSGAFDVVMANPPYVSADEYLGLDPEIREWEPAQALTLFGDGLCAYRRIAPDVARNLDGDGRMIVEIGSAQRDAVTAIFERNGFVCEKTLTDLDNRQRAIVFRLGPV